MMISKNDRYGAQRVFLDQVSSMHRMGHSVVVVGRGTEGFVTESVLAMGVEYHGISMSKVNDLFFLMRLVKNKNIDIIHTALDRADYFGILLSRCTGKPVITTMNVKRSHLGHRLADRVITVSRQQKILLIKKGVNAGKVHMVRPGIDIDRFCRPDPGKRQFWKQKLNRDTHSIVFCHISSMLPQKNHSVSIDLVDSCRKRGEEPLLIIAGGPLEGEYYTSLKKKISDSGLDKNVYFTGWTRDLPELLSLSHFTLLPSVHEALGMVLIEGMAAGTPIVACKGEGGAELIEDYETGFLYDTGEGVPRLAERLMALYSDRTRYAALSDKCRNLARNELSLDRFGEHLLRVYSEVVTIPRVFSDRRDRIHTSDTQRKDKQSLRILQIISKNDRYGAQRIFLDQISTLHAMGNQVTVVGRGTEGFVSDSVRNIGIPYHGIPMNGIGDIHFVRRLIKEHNIDVIHTTLDRADTLGLLASPFLGCPVISTMMVPRVHLGFRYMDRVIALSRKLQVLLKQKGVDPSRIEVIRPGVNVERFTNLDEQKRKSWYERVRRERYSIVFCHIASMIPRKAHCVSLELADACKKRGEEPLLIIVGDPLRGSYYESFINLVNDKGLAGNVFFTGWTSEIPEILSLSHFTVLPSENEALGVALMEGMAAGTPIIARSDEGGAELIDDYGTGFVFRPDKGVENLAVELLDTYRKPGRYRELSARCTTTSISEFSMEKFGKRLTDLYARAGL